MPKINTFSVDENEIKLYWEASPKSDIKRWNVYGSPGVTIDFSPSIYKGVQLDGGDVPANAFTLLESVPNRDTNLTPGSVYVSYTRENLGVTGSVDPYYFYIMPVNASGNEMGNPILDEIHAVPFRDGYFVDEAGEPVNVVYKNFEFNLSPTTSWDIERNLNIDSLLGRPAKQIRIDSVGENIWVKFNSIHSDAISVRHGSPYPFEVRRGELRLEKVYIHNPSSGDTTVRIWVAA